MPIANLDRFDASVLSADFPQKTSLSRYRELSAVFRHVLIIFEHDGYYYGFDETAVAMYILFGCHYYRQKGMLVVKIEKEKFEAHMITKRKMRGFRYLVDRNGNLTFEKGTKRFRLQKPVSYYEENLEKIQNHKQVASYWDDPISRHGRGWLDDTWVPVLPSSRANRRKSKS